jgi:hypothetical protein
MPSSKEQPQEPEKREIDPDDAQLEEPKEDAFEDDDEDAANVSK